MYFNILKNDLKRKRTMNIILFIFIVMATAFISSSVNNLISVSNAMNNYIEKSEISDISVYIYNNQKIINNMEAFLSDYKKIDEVNKTIYPYCSKSEISFDVEHNFDCSEAIVLGSVKNCNYKIFDKNNKQIKSINDGEMYISSSYINKYDLKIGDTIILHQNNYSKRFKITGTYKDVIFSAGMLGMGKFIISDNDYTEIVDSKAFQSFVEYGISTDNIKDFSNELNKSEVIIALSLDEATLKTMYIMDMVTASVTLIVSICLILISVFILRFTIIFTLTEEFREIGVMKAIGIKNKRIQWLYCIKYLVMSLVGATIGTLLGIPFGEMLMNEVTENIVLESFGSYFINVLCGVITIIIIMTFCFFATGKLKKFSPIEAIRGGSNGERFKGKGIISLSRSKLKPVIFLSLNDIFSNLKRFGVLILTFTIGIILIIVPVNTKNTLASDELVTWFCMTKSDVYFSNALFSSNEEKLEKMSQNLDNIKKVLSENDIPAKVFQELFFRLNVSKGNNVCSSIALNNSNTKPEDYNYTSGIAPKEKNEVAITHVIAEKIGAEIGDTISIKLNGKQTDFIVTAIFQSMTNMGEGVRFNGDINIDYTSMIGEGAVQIKYTDSPSNHVKAERMEKIKALFPDSMILTGGEYISDMIGVSMTSIVQLILIVVLCINALVTVLMVKSFITKEKGEIGMLKAIGFSNNAIIKWHTIRIGIVLIISAILASLLSTPLAQISSGSIFKMMGASSIKFEVRALEVYVLYPLLVLAVTLTASFLSAQQIRKISASETSNIE